MFDYVDNGINVELDADDKDRAVHWRQQKRATVDNGVDEELDVNNVVVAKRAGCGRGDVEGDWRVFC